MSEQKKASWHHMALVHLVVSAVVGVAVGVAVAMLGKPSLAVVSGWIALSLVHCLWVWLSVKNLDGNQTEEHSQQEQPGRGVTDVVLLLAAFAALGGIGVLLAGGSDKGTAQSYVEGVLGLGAVAGSWFMVHMMFMLRYARLYYGEGDKGIDFPQEDQPDYHDFAYLAFCLGMTYQVSDTDLTNRRIRRTVSRHTLLSYALGAVVLACSINLVVQLAS